MLTRSVKAALALPDIEKGYRTAYQMALRFANKAHWGQTDKAGEPYIKHLIRVSMHCDSSVAKIVALLHDTLEDCAVTDYMIRARFGDAIADSVLYLTRVDGEPYMGYIKRLACDPIAREVKIADLIDNTNLSRLPVTTLADVKRQRKYNSALHYLITYES